MSQRAIDFVNNWIDANIDTAKPADMEHHDSRPQRLAEKCAKAAEEAGITDVEIKDGLGDLEVCMIAAIDRVALAKADK